MIPSLVLVLPIFILFNRVGLTNSLIGVGVADMSITLPFTIWIVSNSIQDTPVELERASRVDGLSRIGSITRIAIPLARSGVRTGGLFAFLFSWNDLIYPLILIVSPGLIMIQPALAGMYNLIAVELQPDGRRCRAGHGANHGDRGVRHAPACARLPFGCSEGLTTDEVIGYNSQRGRDERSCAAPAGGQAYMALIELDNVVKYYGANEVVSALDLVVPDGSFTVLLGPSGCGKTTTLQMIVGLELVSGGAIAFDGSDVTRVPPHKRDVAMVFQSYALYPNKTVYDNMAYGLKIRRTPREETARRVNDAAAMLSIGDLLDRKPATLSGGQRQRVAVGRAVVRRPRAFLLDEPLSNVDAKLRAEMRVELRALQQRLEATFVYVTHDQLEAMTMADQIAVMNAGILQQVGTPEEIYSRPRLASWRSSSGARR